MNPQKLWQAMLIVYPHIGQRLDPHGRAHLVQEHAAALVDEWELVTAGVADAARTAGALRQTP